MSSNYILFVTFGKMTSYPFAMKYGETGTFTFNKSSAYRLEFLDASGVSRYTASISGMSGSTAVPVSVFSTVKASLKTCKVYEIYSGTDIAEKSYNLTVSETACSLSLSALRSPTDADASLVTVSVSGESALSSTSRTVTVYAKETSSEIWNAVGTISPSASQFTGETMSVDLDISYSWDIYGILSDGYTSVQSNIFRIYSKSYIMTKGCLDAAVYSRENLALAREADELAKAKERLASSKGEIFSFEMEIKALYDFARHSDYLKEFDGDLFTRFVDRIIVYSKHEIAFKLKCGLTIAEGV